jgi:hypothetical protein
MRANEFEAIWETMRAIAGGGQPDDRALAPSSPQGPDLHEKRWSNVVIGQTRLDVFICDEAAADPAIELTMPRGAVIRDAIRRFVSRRIAAFTVQEMDIADLDSNHFIVVRCGLIGQADRGAPSRGVGFGEAGRPSSAPTSRSAIVSARSRTSALCEPPQPPSAQGRHRRGGRAAGTVPSRIFEANIARAQEVGIGRRSTCLRSRVGARSMKRRLHGVGSRSPAERGRCWPKALV